jgi:hypothetical protein
MAVMFSIQAWRCYKHHYPLWILVFCLAIVAGNIVVPVLYLLRMRLPGRAGAYWRSLKEHGDR